MRKLADWQVLQPVLKTQREILQEVLLCAARYDVWMTLEELAHKTRYPEASISAQLRHLRKRSTADSWWKSGGDCGGNDAAERARKGVGVPDAVRAVGRSAAEEGGSLKWRRAGCECGGG